MAMEHCTIVEEHGECCLGSQLNRLHVGPPLKEAAGNVDRMTPSGPI